MYGRMVFKNNIVIFIGTLTLTVIGLQFHYYKKHGINGT